MQSTNLSLSECIAIRDNVYRLPSTTPKQASRALVYELAEIAKQHPMKRARVCFHEASTDLIQFMLIVLDKTCVCAPLRQNRSEHLTYLGVLGHAVVSTYQEDGQPLSRYLIGDVESNYPCSLSIPAHQYRTMQVQSPFFAFYEIAYGPFEDQMTQYMDRPYTS